MVKKIYKYVSNDGMEHDTRAACEQRDAELELASWVKGFDVYLDDPGDTAAITADLMIQNAPALLALLKRIVPPTPRQKRAPAAPPAPLLADPPPAGEASGGGAESAPEAEPERKKNKKGGA